MKRVLHVTSGALSKFWTFSGDDHATETPERRWIVSHYSWRWFKTSWLKRESQCGQVLALKQELWWGPGLWNLCPLTRVTRRCSITRRTHVSQRFLCTTCTHLGSSHTAENTMAGTGLKSPRNAESNTHTHKIGQKHTWTTCGYVWIEVWVRTDKSREKECSKNSELLHDSTPYGVGDVCTSVLLSLRESLPSIGLVEER